MSEKKEKAKGTFEFKNLTDVSDFLHGLLWGKLGFEIMKKRYNPFTGRSIYDSVELLLNFLHKAAPDQLTFETAEAAATGPGREGSQG